MKRANGNFSAYVKKTLAAEYQRHNNSEADTLANQQRDTADRRANNEPNNENHKMSPPLRTNVFNGSIGNSARNYTKE